MVTPTTSFCVLDSKTKKLMGGTRAYIFHRKPTVKIFIFCTGTLVPLETSATHLKRVSSVRGILDPKVFEAGLKKF